MSCYSLILDIHTYKRTSCGPKKGHFSPDTFNSIGRTYAFAFSPHGDEFAAYRDRDTRAITWSFLPSQKLDAPSYQSLRRWLELNVPIHSQAAMLDFKVMFSPGASYFASTFSKCTHHDLPPRLANEIDDRVSRRQAPPDTIALGADGTYFAAWGSRCIWHLDDKSALRQSLRDNTTLAKDFANVDLNPTSKTHYVGVMKDGMITYSAPDTNGKLTGHVKAHMQHMAKHFGRTYVVKFKGSMDTVTSIGPETNFAQVDDELIKEQEKKEKEKEKANQKKKTKAQAEAEEVKEDEENLMSKETEAATMEDTKKGGLLSRVFKRKSVALQ